MLKRDLLIRQLTTIHVTDRDHETAYNVAHLLLADIYGKAWHSLPTVKRRVLVRESGNRMWDDYMRCRKFNDLDPAEAAATALDDEVARHQSN